MPILILPSFDVLRDLKAMKISCYLNQGISLKQGFEKSCLQVDYFVLAMIDQKILGLAESPSSQNPQAQTEFPVALLANISIISAVLILLVSIFTLYQTKK